MRNAKSSKWTVFGGTGVLALACWSGAAGADDRDPTDVGLEEAVARATRPAGERVEASPVRLGFRVGEARFVRDLARVDVTLEATNTTAQVLEWDRTFPMDPSAEVIACSLQRAGQAPLLARSLTFEDGRRIYDETVRPRPTVPPNPGKDPLRVERESDGRLRVVVFPVAPSETVRVHLSFATSLADRGRLRHYKDPLWVGDVRREGRLAEVLPEAVTSASLTLEPGVLTGARVEGRLAMSPLSDQRLVVKPLDAVAAAMQAHVRFEAPAGLLPALTVPGAGLGTRIAFWPMDPAGFLAERGIREIPRGARLRFTARGGTQRLVPAEIPADSPALTLVARHYAASGDLAYDVELVHGTNLTRFEVRQPVERAQADAALEDAVGGFYRARLARHVLAWAEQAPAQRRAKALAYAVDLGVILPGTCALALPREEQRTLSPLSRRTYRRDGTEIGAADGDADWVAPPAGSLR
jgi:hypothetical protein